MARTKTITGEGGWSNVASRVAAPTLVLRIWFTSQCFVHQFSPLQTLVGVADVFICGLIHIFPLLFVSGTAYRAKRFCSTPAISGIAYSLEEWEVFAESVAHQPKIGPSAMHAAKSPLDCRPHRESLRSQ
jgi:hypothetical protein